jgi:phospholipase/lecithinase/hemolysin
LRTRSAEYGRFTSSNWRAPGLPQEPQDIVGHIENHVMTLAEAGARHFLVPNFFDIDQAPFIVPLLVSPAWLPPGVPNQEAADDILARADEFNRRLRSALPRLERRLDREYGGVTISQVDMFTTTKVISLAPQIFGIENTTDTALTPPFPACFCTGVIQPGVDPDRYLWFDEIHPTARVHEILGEVAAGSLHPALKTGPAKRPRR